MWVVAPETDQSGVVAFRHAVRPDPAAAGGRAAVCRARHADRLRHHGRASCLIGENPDLVISGVNRGQNIADDVTYSGTVAGAMEGTLLGIPSIALSQAFGLRDRASRPGDGERHGPASSAS